MSNQRAVSKTNRTGNASTRKRASLKVVKGEKGKAKKASSRKGTPLSESEIEDIILEHRANARKISRSILRRWRARIELEELDSLVDLALCEAARRYNPNKGASFITFLFYHLRGCLVRAVDTAANVNTIPAAAYEISELSSDYGVADSNASGTASDIAEALSNREYMLPDEALYRKELASLSNIACSKLDSLEQEVIYRIYALEEPLVDIARTLGYSRCHISRVKKRALEVLHDTLSPLVGAKAKHIGESSIREIKIQRRPVTRRKLNGRELTPTIDADNTLQKLATQCV